MEDSQQLYSEEGYYDVDIDNPVENSEQPKPEVFNTDICKLVVPLHPFGQILQTPNKFG